MIAERRFGKVVPLPSTRQIRHELIVMWHADELRKASLARAAAPASEGVSPRSPPEQAPVA
jgi:hypothetical protein